MRPPSARFWRFAVIACLTAWSGHCLPAAPLITEFSSAGQGTVIDDDEDYPG